MSLLNRDEHDDLARQLTRERLKRSGVDDRRLPSDPDMARLKQVLRSARTRKAKSPVSHKVLDSLLNPKAK
jgi:hypothetical protein